MASAETRLALPFSESEKILQSPPYIHTSGTVPVKEMDADHIFYQSWTDGRAEKKDVDVPSLKLQFDEKQLVWIHGLNDYGGRNSDAIHIWLSAGHARYSIRLTEGFRVIVIDLPAHGRSGGEYVFFFYKPTYK